MADPPPDMIGHISLKLRLVFHTGSDESGSSSAHRLTPEPGREWRLCGVLPEEAVPGEAGEPEGSSQGRITAPVALTLDRDEAEGYYLNLTSPQPSLFVLLRQQDVAAATAVHAWGDVPEAQAVTASYSEAARWMDGGMAVVRTALPEPMLAWIAEFAQYHFRVEGKRKRGSFRPSFLSRREFGDVARVELEQAGQTPHRVLKGQETDGH